MPDSPLEVGLGVSLDEGVDGAHTAMGLGGVVHGLRGVLRRRGISGSVSPDSPHSATRDFATRDSLIKVSWGGGSAVQVDGEGTDVVWRCVCGFLVLRVCKSIADNDTNKCLKVGNE